MVSLYCIRTLFEAQVDYHLRMCNRNATESLGLTQAEADAVSGDRMVEMVIDKIGTLHSEYAILRNLIVIVDGATK